MQRHRNSLPATNKVQAARNRQTKEWEQHTQNHRNNQKYIEEFLLRSHFGWEVCERVSLTLPFALGRGWQKPVWKAKSIAMLLQTKGRMHFWQKAAWLRNYHHNSLCHRFTVEYCRHLCAMGLALLFLHPSFIINHKWLEFVSITTCGFEWLEHYMFR